jgi:hypothetical protein
VLAVGVYMLLKRETEPTYKGKPLSHWLDRLPPNRPAIEPDAREAIQQIGAKAVPWLLKWLAYETPSWRKTVNSFCNQHQFLKGLATDEQQKYRRGWSAACAFGILGREAKKAKPDLVELFKRDTGISTLLAGSALLSVDPEAYPILVEGLRSQIMSRRTASAYGLLQAGTNAVSALPELLEHLDGPGATPRIAAEAAEELIKGGQPAVPYLRKALECRSQKAREWATNALLRIAPEALSNAPPR